MFINDLFAKAARRAATDEMACHPGRRSRIDRLQCHDPAGQHRDGTVIGAGCVVTRDLSCPACTPAIRRDYSRRWQGMSVQRDSVRRPVGAVPGASPGVRRGFRRVIASTAFIGGPFVKEFEAAYPARAASSTASPSATAPMQSTWCCACSASGRETKSSLPRQLDLDFGDDHAGGRTAGLRDVERYYGIDADRIEAAITPRTKAIIPVHLYGQPAQMDAIAELARRRGLFLIEDCAQAHLAKFGGRRVGTFGDAATFSFYPGKNLGAYGDAGAIVTNDEELAQKCRMYANHGALVKHQHEMEGINSRMDGCRLVIVREAPTSRCVDARAAGNRPSLRRSAGGIAEVHMPRVRPPARTRLPPVRHPCAAAR